MTTSLRERLRAGDTLIGTLVTLAAPEVAELLSSQGFDWLFADMEHGPLGVLDVQRILQAMAPGCYGIVRVPASGEVWIKRALDLGCAGIIVPQVNSARDAQQVVSWARYPPEGTRGVGIGRAHGYGMRFGEYVSRANQEIAVIVQAEHVEAVRHIAEIAAVPGVDAVLVGPYDLSGSMGKPGQVGDADVQAQIAHVRETCLAAGMPLGVFGVSADAVRPFMAEGYTLIAVGTDALFMGTAAAGTLAALRE
jgi:2-dehydro-3-deoxyglucarate aldolase